MRLSDEEKAAILREIAEKHGGNLDPKDVVEEAKASSHPLHDYFEWRDKIAGEQFRIDQARALIRSVRIEVKTNSAPMRAPQWVRSPDNKPDQRGYVEVTRVVALEARLRIIRGEIDRAIGVVERLREISAALAIEAEFGAAQEALRALRGRLG
jgi:hypothetical protein